MYIICFMQMVFHLYKSSALSLFTLKATIGFTWVLVVRLREGLRWFFFICDYKVFLWDLSWKSSQVSKIISFILELPFGSGRSSTDVRIKILLSIPVTELDFSYLISLIKDFMFREKITPHQLQDNQFN